MKFFKVGYIYTHTLMLDAAILILKSFKTDTGDYKLKIRWVRKDGFDFALMENIKIKEKDVKDWYVLRN